MLKEERQKIILEKLNQENRVLTTELCSILNVSLDTVRRDLNDLKEEGKLIKVHGGAISRNYNIPFLQPLVYKQQEKIVIASKALDLLEDDMYVLLGGGTIMLELAKILPERKKIRIFTVSPLVALEITQRTSIPVELIGGTVSRESYICIGGSVISKLGDISADICLLGTNGFSVSAGITENDYEVSLVKRSMLAASSQNVIMCLSERVGEEKRFNVAGISEADYFITELPDAHHSLFENFPGHIKIL